ncbi:MAG TPA: carbonic anhydrase [Thermoleophilaceae bacterium]|nr:carbonic anhydrase [Thermoleophilaceae bacterium]
MGAIDDTLGSAERYAEAFGESDLPAPPARRLAVVTCMDARIDPYRLLGLSLGDAHVIRNAGGIVTDDVIRSITISQRKLGTEEVAVIQHTRCGMCGLDDGAFAAEIEADAGERPGWDPGGFGDLDESVRESVRRVRESPFVPRTDAVRGLVYDVDTARLREVA